MPLDLTIAIPIYNSEKIIERSVERIAGILDPLGLNYEILLIDDGSQDSSGKVLEAIDHRYDQVRFSSNGSNEGLGVTLRSLFRKAQGKTIIYCDCDLPFGEKVIPLLLSEIDECDIIVASRYRGLPNYVPLVRKIASRSYYLLCKILYNISVVDIGSGSVALRKEALSQLDLKSQGFGIHAELFVKAARCGLTIKEIPAQHLRTDRGSFHVWKHGFQTICETVTL